MIPHFPSPYPDELLYSLSARFDERMAFSNGYSSLMELFGTIKVKTVVDLPSRIDYLCSQFFPGSRYSSDYFINNHTLLPFYAPFLPQERLETIRDEMCGDRKQGVHMRLGTHGSRVRLPAWLRYCPRCVCEDREKYGECYWHRVHQLPGVEVCATHLVWLENSSLPARGLKEFVTAESSLEGVQLVRHRPINCSAATDSTLLAIAHDAGWLLQNPQGNSQLASLHQQYLTVLAEKGYGTYAWTVHTARLMESFQRTYPPALLERLQCEIEGRHKRNWLACLVQVRPTMYPIRHLLLMHFLGSSVQDFLEREFRRNPFGEGPWLCLNPVCQYYRQPAVQHVALGVTRRTGRKPLGTFRCEHCGFTYSRVGPDEDETAKLRISQVRSYGPLWEETFKRLWQDSSLAKIEIARRMGCSRDTVMAQAKRLMLDQGTDTEPVAAPVPYEDQTRRGAIPTTSNLDEYRRAWLAGRQQHPTSCLLELRELLPDIHRWLDRHDHQWLQSHLPPRKGGSWKWVDWSQRDTDLAQRVTSAAADLKNAPGRPIRVTRNSVTKALGLPENFILRNLLNLPLTAAALEGLVESVEAFAIRRIHHVASEARTEHTGLTWSQLQKRAGLSQAALTPDVLSTMEDVLQHLREASGSNQRKGEL